jgi:hypothetical protein
MSALSTSSSIVQSLIDSLKSTNYSQMLSGLGNNSIVKSFAQMMQSANDANAQRGGDILSLLEGQGTAQLASNQQNYKNQLGGITQSMMDKGLANTSVGNDMNQLAENQLAQNNQAVNESTALNLANMANSFTQQAPDMGILAQLLSKGGGGGGGYVAPNATNPRGDWVGTIYH